MENSPQRATPAVWITIISILAVISAIWWWVQRPAYVAIPQREAVINDKITLTLSGGQIIDLTDTSYKITQTPDAVVYASPAGVTYTPKGNGVTSWNTLYVPDGRKYTLILADGTQIFLNSKTTLRFKFVNAGRKKQLFVDGEAFFRLLPNDTAILTVHTPVTDITTSNADFDVISYDREHVSTILVRGTLEVTDQRTTVTLKPGTAAIYHSDDDFTTEPADIKEILKWTEKLKSGTELREKISTLIQEN
ncbi:FecR domain-containing protein [Chitinophaga sp. Cy-1792]|uniref:FecR domain-containing protein n=1 Tax=Chitinophaga sp. Cy-1792 TaxID=2608339 RepID=UPI001422E74D|nr:FecR domain-containing protein [Chitinophaga sp. Cy-1792]NIG53016.1 FecR domain-containing protein [Chitinophaga sp. Cy-1792]